MAKEEDRDLPKDTHLLSTEVESPSLFLSPDLVGRPSRSPTGSGHRKPRWRARCPWAQPQISHHFSTDPYPHSLFIHSVSQRQLSNTSWYKALGERMNYV